MILRSKGSYSSPGFSRYRLYISATNGGTQASLREFYLFDSGGTNIGLATNGGVASASSLGSGSIAGINDGGTTGANNDFWNSAIASPPFWVMITLPGPSVISSYGFFTSGATANLPRNWQLEGSNDGISWTTLHSVTNASLSQTTMYTYPL